MSRLFRLVAEHLIPSSGIGLVAYWITNEPVVLFAPLIMGWLIDVDHIVDLAMAKRTWKNEEPLLQRIIHAPYFGENGKTLVVLHSWELAFLCGAALWVLGEKDVAAVGITAWIVHLATDQISHKLSPWAYFLTYRIVHGFSNDAIGRN